MLSPAKGNPAKSPKQSAENYALNEQIINDLLDTSNRFFYDNYDSAHYFADSAIRFSEKNNFNYGTAKALRQKGLIFYLESNYTEAFKILQKSYTLYQNMGNKRGQIDALNLIALIYTDQEKYTKAMDLYNTMLTLTDSSDYYNFSRIYNNIGVIHSDLGDYEKCKSFYLKALYYAEKTDNKQGYSQQLNNIGGIYLKLNKPDSALLCINKGMAVAKEINDKQRISNSYESFGEYYYAKGDYKQALLNFQKAHNINEAIQIIYEISSTAKNLSETYTALGDYKNAYHFLHVQKVMEDSIKDKEVASYITQVELEEVFEKERALSDAIHAKERLRKNIYGLISVSVFIIALLLIIGYRQKNKAYQLLHENMEKVKAQKEEIETQAEQLEEINNVKDKLFSVIAHDLRSPLFTLISALELITKKEISQEDFYNFLDKMYRDAQQTGALVDNLLNWAKAQQHGVHLKPKPINLHSLVAETIESVTILLEQKQITVHNLSSKSHIPYADEDTLSLVLRNIISNAIKYSYTKGNIYIRSTENNHTIHCEISDEGTGIDNEKLQTIFEAPVESSFGTTNEKGSGLGLLLSYDFIKLNGGNLSATSKKGKGSTFTLALKTDIK